MDIKFKDKRLRELYENPDAKGFKGFPANLIKPFRKTIQKLEESNSFEDLKKFRSLDLKPCDYYKNGCYVVRINQQYRLIFECYENQTVILVLEAIDYHDSI